MHYYIFLVYGSYCFLSVGSLYTRGLPSGDHTAWGPLSVDYLGKGHICCNLYGIVSLVNCINIVLFFINSVSPSVFISVD